MKKLLALLVLVLSTGAIWSQPRLTDLRVNHLREPLGVDPDAGLNFSWIIESSGENVSQASYALTLKEAGKVVWRSEQTSDNSAFVKAAVQLKGNTRYDWSVKVTDNFGKSSKLASSFFCTGLRREEWKAEWIGSANSDCTVAPTPILLRTSLPVRKSVKAATAYVTAHGWYEAFLGGARLGDGYLTPGWTSYGKTLQYQAYDVKNLLKKGDNTLSVLVTPGWWASGLVWGDPAKRFRYGKDLSLLMQVNVTYSDGTSEVFGTSPEWEMSRTCEVADATLYDGETVDKTAECRWEKPELTGFGYDNLAASVAEPVRVHKVVKPVKYIVTPKGEKVLDFGQNLVGWERLRICGKRGQKLTVSHAEVLDENGNFYTVNLRKAKALSNYVLSGGEDVFQPCHTFYGFRYLRVEGVEGDLNPDDFEAVAVNSGFDDIGHFACSDEVVNKLQSNIDWGFRGNFLDIPTDCPQRDERLGWTGDAQVFFRTASFLGRVENFFDKWLRSVADDQREDGGIPRVIPDTFPDSDSNFAAGWADCATIIPWQHYQAYGDIAILEKQYKSMKGWADYLIGKCKDNGYLLNTLRQPYGDWLYWSVNNDRDGKSAVTNKNCIAQCFFVNSLDIVSKSAEILGNSHDHLHYANIANLARRAYMDEYVTVNGMIVSDSQTAYVQALHFNMLPEQMREVALERLVSNISGYGYHITTGFLGTPYICEVLTDAGRSDVAYKLLLQKSCPGWLYPVSLGATTIWERWNSMNADGSIPDNGMNSFNHYSYGAIGDWLYRSAVGIRETAPGYRTFEVNPHVGGGMTWMEASTRTPYGEISVRWEAAADRMTSLEVKVPVGTKAIVHCPDGEVRTVGSGCYKF